MDEIEEQIFRSLLFDKDYNKDVMPYLESEYFEGWHNKFFKIFKRVYDKYKKIPTSDVIIIEMSDDKTVSDEDYLNIEDFLERAIKSKNEVVDNEWLFDKTEEYCKHKSIIKAIYESVDVLDNPNKNTDSINALPKKLQKAIDVSFRSELGYSLIKDSEKVWNEITSPDSVIPYHLEALNDMTDGGVRSPNLICFIAQANEGKSLLMADLSTDFLKRGKNVVYISMEMSEKEILERMYANIMGVSTEFLQNKDNKEFFDLEISKLKSKTKGDLIVQQYPTRSAHAGHFRHFLNELKKQKTDIDIIFIDYMNICKSANKQYGGSGKYEEVMSIAEELRALSVEFGKPVITATQANRSAYNTGNIAMENISDSIGIAYTIDVLIGLSSDDTLKEQSKQKLTLLKSRYKKRSLYKIIDVDWNCLRYSDPSNEYDIDIKEKIGKNGNVKPIDTESEIKNFIDWS